MSPRLRRIVLATAVLPLVVLIGLRSAWAYYACTVTGEVRTACCCPQKAESERPVDDAQRIDANCCCDVSIGESSNAPDARTSDASRAVDVPWVGAVAAIAPLPRTTRPATRIAMARPPPLIAAVPTYLANRTILR